MRQVFLEILSFQFCIGGEHFYGSLKEFRGGRIKEAKVTHRLTKKEADYLNQKDGLKPGEGYGFEWKAGVESERFASRDGVIRRAVKM